MERRRGLECVYSAAGLVFFGVEYCGHTSTSFHELFPALIVSVNSRSTGLCFMSPNPRTYPACFRLDDLYSKTFTAPIAVCA